LNKLGFRISKLTLQGNFTGPFISKNSLLLLFLFAGSETNSVPENESLPPYFTATYLFCPFPLPSFSRFFFLFSLFSLVLSVEQVCQSESDLGHRNSDGWFGQGAVLTGERDAKSRPRVAWGPRCEWMGCEEVTADRCRFCSSVCASVRIICSGTMEEYRSLWIIVYEIHKHTVIIP